LRALALGEYCDGGGRVRREVRGKREEVGVMEEWSDGNPK